MLCSGLSSTLLLAATCSLITSGFIRAEVSVPPNVTALSTGRVATSNGLRLLHLSCEGGMIIVRSAVYRCGGEVICSEGVNNVKNSCDGKTECDIQSNITYDPGVCKYLETTYDCFPRHNVTCEGSQANLQCGKGQVIVVSWANYGRRDTTTCPGKYTIANLNNVNCISPGSMEYVTNRCNWQNSCTVRASHNVFGDPCGGTYKYLEVFYTCQAGSCPPGWTWFGGRCFIFESSKKIWTDAERSCKTLGGNLASFHSTAEYSFIRELIYTAAGSHSPAWVGGRKTEAKWMWSDGSQFDFPNWGSGQPDNYGGVEDCMMINNGGQDYVNDVSCDSQISFVCVGAP